MSSGDPSQATRILAIRHGETAWNHAGRIQGQLDIGLNDTGRWQAQRLAQALADEPLAAVYASDLCRASETARVLTALRGIELRIEPGLRERGFGAFEGLTAAEIEQQHPVAARRWRQRDPGFGPDGGETLLAFHERALAAVAALAARHRGQQVAVVCHGGVLDALYRAAAGVALDAPRTWSIGNASVNRVLASAAGFSLLDWADGAHLAQSALDDVSDGRLDARPRPSTPGVGSVPA